uniref:PI-PLC X domain-containing protein 2 n=1 Tax=Geotrypetes seraphini TaxID=260995 RepID=A0A6P8QJY7_GEOSA|nr:PI-PLC X domain-containing protein 2 [Geotrypetes seraphini]
MGFPRVRSPTVSGGGSSSSCAGKRRPPSCHMLVTFAEPTAVTVSRLPGLSDLYGAGMEPRVRGCCSLTSLSTSRPWRMAEMVPADWMGSLAPGLSSLPLANLAIPGSHDSFSFWVDEKSPVGPDQAASIKRLAKISLVKNVMKRWCVTQSLTFNEQLEAGIRYFDFRVSSKSEEDGEEIFFIHGLFGIRVWDGLRMIDTFLTHHSKEIVLLDFNHFYAMRHSHHMHLINILQEIFGSKLCMTEQVEDVTLQYLWKKGFQVIIFYHYPVGQDYPFLWSGKQMPAPWANTTNVDKLIQFLETTLSERSRHGAFHVSQAILTPRLKTILRGYKTGLNTLVERNLPLILSWIKSQKPGIKGVNIITSDFVELVGFAETVIGLNNLLLQDERPASQS